MTARRTPSRKNQRIEGLLGVGLDNQDGHSRVTKGDDFCLVGGSEETHERMQELVVRMHEKLRRQGKKLRDLNRDEFEELAGESFS